MKRKGYTLLEVIVVLALLALLLGVSGVALASLETPAEGENVRELHEARAEAIRSGTQRTTHGVLFLPDGRVITAGVHLLTGVPDAQ